MARLEARHLVSYSHCSGGDLEQRPRAAIRVSKNLVSVGMACQISSASKCVFADGREQRPGHSIARIRRPRPRVMSIKHHYRHWARVAAYGVTFFSFSCPALFQGPQQRGTSSNESMKRSTVASFPTGTNRTSGAGAEKGA